VEGNGRGEEKVKGKEGERWREGFGPPKNFGVAPPMRSRDGPADIIGMVDNIDHRGFLVTSYNKPS